MLRLCLEQLRLVPSFAEFGADLTTYHSMLLFTVRKMTLAVSEQPSVQVWPELPHYLPQKQTKNILIQYDIFLEIFALYHLAIE